MTSALAIKADYHVTGAPFPLEEEVEAVLYRIGQEAVTNALRHASPTTIRINLEYRDGLVELSVKDDGCGFLVKDGFHGNGFGVIGMYERAQKVGGDLKIESSRGRGTVVTAVVPVPVLSETEERG